MFTVYVLLQFNFQNSNSVAATTAKTFRSRNISRTDGNYCSCVIYVLLLFVGECFKIIISQLRALI